MEEAHVPGEYPDDIYWHEDEYLAVDVELDGDVPSEVGSYISATQAEYGLSTPTGTAKIPQGWTRKKTPKPPTAPKDAEPAPPPNEFVIAVFGMTGTGKSSFINKLTDQDIGIGHGLHSYTSEIQEVRFQLGGLNIKLVDTPGFDDTTRSDAEILTLIASWMKDAYAAHTKLTGVIYLHRISDQRMTGSSMKNLRMLRSLCGTENLSHVSLVTTMWDTVEAELGQRREAELIEEGNFWGSMTADGARVRRHDNTKERAMILVNELLQLSPVVLQIQKEIAIEKKTLIQTDAGQSVSQDLANLTKKYETELAEVKEELEFAKKEKDSKYEKELQTEREALQEKVKKAEADKKTLNAPVNRKSWFTFSWKCKKCSARLTKARDEHRANPRGKCPKCHFVQMFV